MTTRISASGAALPSGGLAACTLLLMALVLLPSAAGAEETLRVVVTGIDDSGRSVIVSDAAPGLILRGMPGGFMGDLWKTDALPATTQSGYAPREYALEPEGAGGVSFRISSIPPEREGAERPDEQEFGMHRTDTIDFITIISGTIHMQLDGGQEVRLEPGDALVQRGTNHAWINRGEVPCVFSAVMVRAAAQTPGKEPGAH